MNGNGLLFSDPPVSEQDKWEATATEAAVDENALYLELDGWEGPLDLLLDLARRQKVDLRSISILSLVDQYLGDGNEAVRNASRNAARDIVAQYGSSDEAITTFLPQFEAVLKTGQVDVKCVDL